MCYESSYSDEQNIQTLWIQGEKSRHFIFLSFMEINPFKTLWWDKASDWNNLFHISILWTFLSDLIHDFKKASYYTLFRRINCAIRECTVSKLLKFTEWIVIVLTYKSVSCFCPESLSALLAEVATRSNQSSIWGNLCPESIFHLWFFHYCSGIAVMFLILKIHKL